MSACCRIWVYLIDIAQPFADVLKALGVGDVIDQHDAHGSSVVGGGDGVKPLLACRVPASTDTQLIEISQCLHYTWENKIIALLWLRSELENSNWATPIVFFVIWFSLPV